MFGLRARLHGLAGHLPQGFDAGMGLKRLFPSGYNGSIQTLNNYVLEYDSGSQISGGQLWFGADGAGRWFFPWWNDGSSGGDWGQSHDYRAGFVFRFSNDGFAHGYADNSRPAQGATSCNAGMDAWISEHWPQAFAANVAPDFQYASGFESLPDESYIWTDAGFPASKFTALKGANCQCAQSFLNLFPFTDFQWGHTAPLESIPFPFTGSDPFSGYSS